MTCTAFTVRSLMAAQPSCRWRMWQLHSSSVRSSRVCRFHTNFNVGATTISVTYGSYIRVIGVGSCGCRFRTQFMSAQPSCPRMAVTFEFGVCSRGCFFRTKLMSAKHHVGGAYCSYVWVRCSVHADAVFVQSSCRCNDRCRWPMALTSGLGAGSRGCCFPT